MCFLYRLVPAAKPVPSPVVYGYGKPYLCICLCEYVHSNNSKLAACVVGAEHNHNLNTDIPFTLAPVDATERFTDLGKLFWASYFGQAKFTYGGSVLDSSQFSVLPQLPL